MSPLVFLAIIFKPLIEEVTKMVTFEFNDFNEMVAWREDYIKKYHEKPYITAKIIKGEYIIKATVSL